MMKYLTLIPFVIIAVSCNKQEVFINDTDNWKRVFGKDKPRDVEILNSYVWKASDYYEVEFYFKLKFNKQFYLSSVRGLREIDFDQINYTRFKQKWFAPNPGKHYKVFIHGKNTDLNTVVIFDTKESIIYYHDIYW